MNYNNRKIIVYIEILANELRKKPSRRRNRQDGRLGSMGTAGGLNLECRFEKILFLHQETEAISHLELFSKCPVSFGFLLYFILYQCVGRFEL